MYIQHLLPIPESQAILSLYPESERRRVLDQKVRNGLTVLDEMNGKTRDSVMEWLSRSESSGSGTNLNRITMQMQSDL